MEKNIKIAYLLSFLKNSWFWLGVWIFYYLRYTNYAGIGILESVLIISMTLGEIPTGAIGDLLGKRRTLMMSFFLQATGLLLMSIAPNFSLLAFAIFLAGVGASFYSGTFDALIYDSLKQEGKEKSYPKVVAHVNSIAMIASAVCGALGGFMYVMNPSLPFLASSLGYGIGLIFTFFLKEPSVDTVIFNLKNFIAQTQKGFRELFKSTDIKSQTILLLSVGVFIVIADEMLNSFLGVEFGFNEKQIGILWALIYIVSALASQLTPYVVKSFKVNRSLFIVGVLIAVSFIISPVLGILLGGLTLLIRNSLQTIFDNLTTITINTNTESKYRAVTLSTYNMIKNIPYVLSAYFIGSLADTYSAKIITSWLGIILLGILATFAFPRIFRFLLRLRV